MICKKCGNYFPSSELVNGKRQVYSSRKFCFECSPYKLHNTINLICNDGFKICSSCKEEKLISEFYKRKGRRCVGSWCKQCLAENVLRKQRAFKSDCINYKGGKCEICGYCKCYGALEFHHKQPEEKSFNIGKWKLRGLCAEAKFEIDKCKLLCVNCHRELQIRVPKITITEQLDGREVKFCNQCLQLLSLDCFGKNGVCKNCHRENCAEAARLSKQRCVEYKGGKCEKCGYNRYIGALEFHHKDPTQKEFTFGKIRKLFSKMKKELDKCSLLCGNCHREQHWLLPIS